jgi:hypothetical protein
MYESVIFAFEHFRERFLVLQYMDKFDDALAVLYKWQMEGKIKVCVGFIC